MKKLTHPNVIIGFISLILLFIGVGMWANGYRSAYYVWLIAFIIGGIHWVWAIIDVLKQYNTRKTSHEDLSIFWVILVIIIPPVGGLLYYGLGRHVKI